MPSSTRQLLLRGTQLLTADATGGVYAKSSIQNLTGDTLTYDTQPTRHRPRPGDCPVTFTDTTNASPLLARSWDGT